MAAQIVLAAADRQLLTLQRTGDDGARLRVRLPLVESPAAARDWAWHVLPVALPPTVAAEASVVHPTVRVAKGRVRVDLPFQIPIGFAPATGHRVGCGFDWGLNGLLTGVAAELTDGRVVSDGRMLRYDASGDLGEAAPAARPARTPGGQAPPPGRLLAGLTVADPRYGAVRTDWHARAAIEHERVCARIRRLNRALAWSAARWAVDQAIATGGGVIYLEDLATLEARGRQEGQRPAVGAGARPGGGRDPAPGRQGRHRGGDRPGARHLEVLPALRHRHSALKHVAAPDRPHRAGWRWARCSCGLSRIGIGQPPSGSWRVACWARPIPAPTGPPGTAPSPPWWRATSPAPGERAGPPGRPGAPAAPEPTCTRDRQHATEPRTAPPRNGPPAPQPTHETTR